MLAPLGSRRETAGRRRAGALRGAARRGRARHAARGDCSHVSWMTGRWWTPPALAGRCAGAARRRAGAGSGSGRRQGARLRLLRRLGAEVAVRAGGLRLPLRARGADRGAAAPWPATARSRTRAPPLDFEPADDARRFDAGRPAAPAAWALAALDVLESAGIAAVLTGRRAGGATGERLGERGAARAVDARVVGAADPRRRSSACASSGFVLRNLPGTPYVRASVGAWNDRGGARAAGGAATSGS